MVMMPLVVMAVTMFMRMPVIITMAVAVRLALLVLYAVFYVLHERVSVHFTCSRNFNYLGVPVQVTHLLREIFLCQNLLIQ